MFTAHVLTPDQATILGWSLVTFVSTAVVFLALKTAWNLAICSGAEAILVKHDEFKGMMVAANSWPEEGRAFRADTFDATVQKLLVRLHTIGTDNATIIHSLDVIASYLSERPDSPAVLAEVKADLTQVDKYVSRLPHVLAGVSSTLAHLSPSARLFGNGIKCITAKYDFVLADKNAPLWDKLYARWALFVLGWYGLDDASKYMAKTTREARRRLTKRENEFKVIEEMLPAAVVRLERAESQP